MGTMRWDHGRHPRQSDTVVEFDECQTSGTIILSCDQAHRFRRFYRLCSFVELFLGRNTASPSRARSGRPHLLVAVL